MDTNPGTSYHDFLRIYNREEQCNKEIDEAADAFEDTDVIEIEDESSMSETDMMISKLCRVCGNRGQIYIYAVASEKYLTIPKTRLEKFKDVTIAQMIEHISSEKVDKSDSMPQFICPHCLSYLQHAYNVRLEILHTSGNLREARNIASSESIVFEACPPARPLTLNQQEIINTNEEIQGDKYWYENFDKKNAKIKIATPTKSRIQLRKAEEIKCPGCFRKSYGAKSHNEHMSNCLINVLKIFFGEFQMIYKARFEKRLTQEEYLMSAISLIFNYKKKVEVIAKKHKMDTESISKILPEIPLVQGSAQEVLKMTNFGRNKAFQNNRNSPADNGYFSNTQ